MSRAHKDAKRASPVLVGRAAGRMSARGRQLGPFRPLEDDNVFVIALERPHLARRENTWTRNHQS